ncbi:kelch repeat and BTB domain-containing protein 4 [Platysternon megacephalum]|uniref:Kelch repeat and BTB domain-containing protein 4 n=1 Tax=Platysternon megacephalum TaxID=55544 RepID=A0A4D9EWC5_9SAUR|nr:kelch repeat and BTB domain-containing protein 4 [Platysternon megacephalum]
MVVIDMYGGESMLILHAGFVSQLAGLHINYCREMHKCPDCETEHGQTFRYSYSHRNQCSHSKVALQAKYSLFFYFNSKDTRNHVRGSAYETEGKSLFRENLNYAFPTLLPFLAMIKRKF